MIWLVLALILVAGYATQRGGICAVAATEALVRERRPGRFLAFLFCAAVGLTLLAGAALAGRSVFHTYPGASAMLTPALGGIVFGAGAWVNGACAFGTVAQLGSGRIARVATIIGFITGSALAFGLGMDASPRALLSPLRAASPVALLIGAGAASATLGFWLARQPRAPDRRGWTPALAMAVIGAVNALLLVLATRWPYTNLLMDLARMSGDDIPRRALVAVVFIVGAIGGGVAGGGFRLASGPFRLWTRSAAGGALMGLGASLVPGGNDTMLLVGLPLLLPNLAAAYLAMAATLSMLEIAAVARNR
jgi:hypothetical protein